MGGCTSNTKDDKDGNMGVVESNNVPPVSSLPSMFTPEVGFTVKTKLLDETKTFINVFHHSSVMFVLTQPMQMSKAKAGDECATFNVVINTAVLTITSTNEESKVYVCEQILDYLHEMYVQRINLNFKFPKIKRGYVGEDIPTFTEVEAEGDSRRLLTTRVSKEPAKAAEINESALLKAAEVHASMSTRSQTMLKKSPNTSAKNNNTSLEVISDPVESSDLNSLSNEALSTHGATVPASCEFSGYAMKKSASGFVGWQMRFFHLSDFGVLSYYQTEHDFVTKQTPKGSFDLADVNVAAREAIISDLSASTMIFLPLSNRVYEMETESPAIARQWKEKMGIFWQQSSK